MSSLQLILGWLCHQLPSRSPHLDELTFPLCYRCAGLHLGFVASFLYLRISGGGRRRLPRQRIALGLSALLVPLMVDGGGNLLELWSTPGWLRAATGMSAGVSLPLLLVPLTHPESMTRHSSPSVPGGLALCGLAAMGAALLWLLLHPGWPAVFRGLAVAALAGTLLFVTRLLQAAWEATHP